MMASGDGGDVFPKEIHETRGMSLRDLYIGLAMCGLVAKDYKEADIGQLAVDIADATMLANMKTR